MTRRVLFIHYTPPGIIGGVEHILYEHFRLLSARGFDVHIAAGRATDTPVPLHVVPELDAAGPSAQRVEKELDVGVVSPRFVSMRRSILEQLEPLAADADVVVAHNALTLHFNQPLSAVLWELAARRPHRSLIAWSHDLAWTNPLYAPRMHAGYPWDLLRTPAPGVLYVTVSAERKRELTALWGRSDLPVTVVPNGIDAGAFLRLSPETRTIVDRFGLFDRDIVLLLPVRITRRKNIESAIRAVRALKDQGYAVSFLVSGPQAPHHPGRSDVYLGDLVKLREELELEGEVVFLAHDLGENLTAEMVAELYAIADVLLFPSSQEGFGLPILEAGLARLPVVVSDIEIFREVGGHEVWTFPLDAQPDTIAAVILQALNGKPSRLYRRVLREYRWDAIVDRQIVPLLERHGVPSSADAAVF